MATSVVFGNKVCKLPGSYARVVSGIERETPMATYGNLLLIDAGAGKGFVSTKGIIGNGKECIYQLDEESANYYIKGGPLAPVIKALFNPDSKNSRPGISSLLLIKASESTPASANKNSLFGGKISTSKILTKEEGDICNTYPQNIKANDTLKKGFLMKCVYSTTTGKGFIELYQGNYEGTNFGGFNIGYTEEEAGPVLIYRSKKCKTPSELVTFLNKSIEFKNLISVTGLADASSDNSFGDTDINEFITFSGGSDTYITKASQ